MLRELALIGFSDMEAYIKFQKNGEVLFDWSALPPGATKVIHEITQETYVEGAGDDARQVKRTRFKLHGKIRALELLAKHLGMLQADRVNDDDDVLLQRIAQLQQDLLTPKEKPTIH